MNANQVDERLAKIGLSEEEQQAVRCKITAGSINPINWNFLNDLDLAVSLRDLIQQQSKSIFPFHFLTFI